MSRISKKWKKDKRFTPVLSGEDKDFMDLFHSRQKTKKKSKNKKESLFDTLLDHCVEVIYNKTKKEGVKFELVLRAIDTKTFDIVIARTFSMYGFNDRDEIKLKLVQVMAKEVPIYGNTPQLQGELEELQRDLIKNGFEFKDKTGKKVRFKISKYKSVDFKKGFEVLDKISDSCYVNPGIIKLANESLSQTFNEYINAADFIKKLDGAIIKFEELLSLTKRNEGKLQQFLTKNPILFGTEYKRIIPKHRLGSEYEMDYALEKYGGVFDLAEIEASSLKIFTGGGNPTKELTHAEQQVLDWQEWLEENNFYARRKLKDIRSPKGYVIIGRNQALSSEDKKKLARRNVTFNDKIQVLTYDDLLEKAKALSKTIRQSKL